MTDMTTTTERIQDITEEIDLVRLDEDVRADIQRMVADAPAGDNQRTLATVIAMKALVDAQVHLFKDSKGVAQIVEAYSPIYTQKILEEGETEEPESAAH